MKNLLINLFSKINPDLLIFAGVYLLLWQANSAKTLLIPFALSFLLLFVYRRRNIFDSAFLTLLLSIPFENVIREWVIYSPSPGDNSGFYYSFGLSPKLVLSVLTLLILLLPNYRRLFDKLKWDKPNILIILFFCLTILTSVFFQYRTTTVFLGVIRISMAIAYYFLARIFFSLPGKKKLFVFFILALSVFTISVGTLQLIKQRQVGKFLELTPTFSDTGYVTTDGKPQFRVSGFISHPVYFGSFVSILTPIFIGIVIKNKDKKFLDKNLFFLGVTLILLMSFVLLGTLSRSVWINLTLITILFLLYIRHNRLAPPPLILPPIIRKLILPVVVISITLPLIALLVIRSQSVPSLFEPGGSGSVRLSLAIQSLELIKENPLTGVGLNNSVFEQLVGTKLPNTIIAPPHNTFLLFLSELGIPTTLAFIAFIAVSLFSRLNIFNYSPLTFGVWVGLLTFLISSQIHPLFNQDPTLDLFMVGLGFLSTCRPFRI